MENLLATQKSRLNFNVTTELNDKLNSWAERLKVTLSELSRTALTEYIEKLERNREEQELAEACKNYREFNKKISSELARYETRI